MPDVLKDNPPATRGQVFSVDVLTAKPGRYRVAVEFPPEILSSLVDHAGGLVDAIVAVVGDDGANADTWRKRRAEAKEARKQAKREFLSWGCELSRELEIRREAGEPAQAVYADLAARHDQSQDIIRFAISQHRKPSEPKAARDARMIRMAMDGASDAEIGQAVGLHPKSVNRILSGYRRQARTMRGERLASVLRKLDRQAAVRAARGAK